MVEQTKQYAVKALIVENGKALFLWDPNFDCKDKWDLPGGRKRPDESDIETLTREVMEEAWLEVKIERIVDEWEQWIKARNWMLMGKTYLCTPITKEVKLEDPEKQHTEFRWIPIKEAKGLSLMGWLKGSLTAFDSS